jgi:hypothetical protein
MAPLGAFVAVVIAAVATRIYAGQPGAGVVVLNGGVGLIALWSLWDGLRRVLGRQTYMGTGRGVDRLFGLLQAVLVAGLALALLPNTLAFLNLLARLALQGAPVR